MFFSHQRSGNSWRLHLSNSSKKDAGLYECQINTEPKIHLPFHLSVSGKYNIYNGVIKNIYQLFKEVTLNQFYFTKYD